MDSRGIRGVLPLDVVAIGYLGLVSILLIIFRDRVPSWPVFLAAHVGLGAAVLAVVRLHDRPGGSVLRVARFWYPVVVVPALFKLNTWIVPRVSPEDLDLDLLAWDRMLFGAHPARYLAGIESPVVTDLLRICWMSYFVLPFVVAVPLYWRRRGNPRIFVETTFAFTAGWCISYLGYFLTPAIGPGYYPDLVGTPPVWPQGTTEAMLTTLWTLEGQTVRDTCPSGHVIIAGLALWASIRARMAIRWILAPVVSGLVLGTVYLRFHYGVDVLMGGVVVGVVAIITPVLHRSVPENGHET